MVDSDAIVQPFVLPAGQVGGTVIMVSNQADLMSLGRLLQVEKKASRQLMMSRLFQAGNQVADGGAGISVLGPVIGAAYAAMLAEIMITSGAKKIIFYGWCGSLSSDIKTGDIFIPDQALVDEGVSSNYLSNHLDDEKHIISRPCPELTSVIADSLKQNSLDYSQGRAWTTDAIFRETPAKVKSFQQQQAQVVEMETSALFSVAAFRGISAAAVLVVSDELSTLTWRPGFKDKRFLDKRQALMEVISQIWSVI